MTDRHLGILVHGEWGSGKSWFGDSAPGPRLLISAEGQHMDTPSNKVIWDGRSDLPELGPDDTAVLNVTGYREISPVIKMLREGTHPFNSVVVDSLHELQNQAKVNISSGGAEFNPDALFDQQSWGRLLNHLESLIRTLRDCTRETAKRPVHYVLVCGSDTERMPHTPMLQGGLRKTIAGFPNVVGYLRTYVDDGEVHRWLQLRTDTTAVAKNNVHQLAVNHPEGIKDPSITEMLEELA